MGNATRKREQMYREQAREQYARHVEGHTMVVARDADVTEDALGAWVQVRVYVHKPDAEPESSLERLAAATEQVKHRGVGPRRAWLKKLERELGLWLKQNDHSVAAAPSFHTPDQCWVCDAQHILKQMAPLERSENDCDACDGTGKQPKWVTP